MDRTAAERSAAFFLAGIDSPEAETLLICRRLGEIMGFWKTFGRALARLGNQSDRIMAVVSASIASSLAIIGVVVVFPIILVSLTLGPIGLFFGIIGALASSLVAKTMALAAPTTLLILPTTALLVPARYGLRRLALLVIGSLGGWERHGSRLTA